MKTNSPGFFPVVALLAGLSGLAGCETDLSSLGVADPTTPSSSPPAVLDLIASAPQLSSAANVQSAGVTVTALVKDSGNRVVSGAAVLFSVNNGASIISTQSTTDSSGVAQAVVTTGNDPTNRTLLVTATAGIASDTLNLAVVGTTITIAGPTTAQFNQAATFVVDLQDSAGQGISGRTVTLSSADGQGLSATTLSTNGSGQVSFTYTVNNNNPSPDTLTATALGIADTHDVVTSSTDSFTFFAPAANTEVVLGASQALTLRWTQNGVANNGQTISFATTRGTLTSQTAVTAGAGDATVNVSSTSAGIATVQASSTTGKQASLLIEFVATTPSKISLQADPAVVSTNSSSQITATVRDAADNLVKNIPVEFLLDDVSGGTISAAQVTTNSLGLAKVVYSSSSNVSATDGVKVTARVATSPGINAQTLLTVGGRAARLVLGTGNEIFEPNETTYQFPYSVIVTDNNGAAVSGAKVFLSIEPVSYGKGFYGKNAVDEIVAVRAVTCANEDTNLNGQLDSGEDVNSNSKLEPSNIAAVPLSVTVGADGTFQFNIIYPQDRGNWVDVKLSARTTVSGTETRESVLFTLPISADDADNPPGKTTPTGTVSPYGTANVCSDPD